ncbi:MAG: FtsQ-type POTRA domain-containing protein [Isosphaeraceae bacterium]|nr:FtsQ-type POTRA domain-containing protein [Isosphaeraceae bacterium]
MDRRDPPPVEPPTAPRSFAPVGAATALHRLATPRSAGAALAGVATLALLAAGWAQAIGWLHDRPAYQARFGEIVLDPAPPPWIRSGAAGLLERVRERAKLPEPLPVLGLDLGEIRRAFAKHSPWVEAVERVERSYPNRLIVRLRYRRPVAVVWEGPGAELVLDREAVVLPGRDLDRQAAGPLIEIQGLKPPLNAREGLTLGRADGTAEVETGERLARSAAKLAAFLQGRLADAPLARRKAQVVMIHVCDGAPRLWAKTGEDLWIAWGEAPGEETPGNVLARTKWDLYRDWVERQDPYRLQESRDREGTQEYLELLPTGARLRRGRLRH